MKPASHLIAPALILLGASFLWAQDNAEEVLARLGALSPLERERKLAEGARREGEVMVYFADSPEDFSAWVQPFKKKYSSIQLKSKRLRGGSMADAALTEHRTRHYFADVFLGSTSANPTLVRGGAVARYLSPERANFPDWHKDKHGFWTAFFSRHVVFAYNVNLVDQKKLPKDYFALLDPYWKGRLVTDANPATWLATMIRAYGKEKAVELVRGLVRNEIKVIRGRTLQAQLMAAGEFAGSLDQSENNVVEFKKKGAPLDYIFMENTPALTNPVSLAKHAPHPHAAALFIDTVLSAEGQQAIVDTNSIAPRPGFLPKDAELRARLAKAKVAYFDMDWYADHQVEIAGIVRDVLLRGRR